MGNYRAIYHQSLAAIPVCLIEFATGIATGWVSPMLKKFLQDPSSEIRANKAEGSAMASMIEFGRMFGPLLSLLLLDILGRKTMLQITAVVYFAFWLDVVFTRSVLALCIGLFIHGLANGSCQAASPVYLGENGSPHLRGIFCSISTTGFYLGLVIQYVIAEYLSYHNLAMVNLIITFGCLASTFLLVESAQFLMLKERFSRAMNNMMWLKGTSQKDDIITEFETIKGNIASEKLKKTSYRKLITSKANAKSLAIILGLNMIHAATGNAVMFTYISILFSSKDFLTAHQIMIIFGISEIAFCILASFLIENFNRKTLAMLSFALFLVSHTSTAYFMYDAEFSSSPAPYGKWVMFVSVCAFSGMSTVVDSVIHMLRGELFPQSIRPIGSALSISTHSLFELIPIALFLMIRTKYGTYINFLGYAIVSLVALLYTYFILPETRGKTLIEIQKLLE